MKIIITGGAGLVGQNLVARLKTQGYNNLVVLDKHRRNLAILSKLHPEITTECVDLSEKNSWQQHFSDADVVVMLQAQIGGNDYSAFLRNNINATENILEALKSHQVPHLVHISSSVVNSVANDFYTNTKKQQEALVLNSNIPCVVLRPTLMFGWFDRKHFGWLSRFMKKTPVFPIPGHGRYTRQPLYAGDFCNIIISCIKNKVTDDIYNISGREKINYVDIIRDIKQASEAKTSIIHIPYHLFYALLWMWSLFDKNPPFTTQQLSALIANDEFEVIDWPSIFAISATPFKNAINETFCHPQYSQVKLEF